MTEQLSKQTIGNLLAFNGEKDVPAVEAVIVSVGKYTYHATGHYGPYSYQDIVIGDNGQTMKCLLDTRPEMTGEWVGHRVAFIASRSNGGKLSGLKTQMRNQNLVLVVKKAAQVVPVTDAQQMQVPQPSPSQQMQAPPPMQAQQPPPMSAPQQLPPQTPPPMASPTPAPAPAPQPHSVAPNTPPRPQLTPEQRVKRALDWLESIGNFVQLAWEEAYNQKRIFEANHPDFKIPDQAVVTAAAGMCAGAANLGISGQMPPGDITKYLPQSDQNPPAQ